MKHISIFIIFFAFLGSKSSFAEEGRDFTDESGVVTEAEMIKSPDHGEVCDKYKEPRSEKVKRDGAGEETSIDTKAVQNV